MAIVEVGRWGLRVPDEDEEPDVPGDLLRLATDLSSVAMDLQGTLAARPVSTVLSPGVFGRYYFVQGDADAAQNRRLWRDTGAGWDEIPIGPGSRPDLGDYKMTAQDVDHGDLGGGLYAWLKCDAREVSAGYARLVAFLTGIGSPFGTGPGGRPRLPDPQGRVPVFLGSHADVNVLGDSDGEALANRSPKHHHGTHSHTIATPAGAVFYSGAGPNDTGSGAFDGNSAGIALNAAQVGPTGTPLHGPAHLVLGHLFMRAT